MPIFLAVTYKDIPGFPGYRVGDNGVVLSCWHRKSLGHGRGSCRVMVANDWVKLSAIIDTAGRPLLNLCCRGERFKQRVARLVLLAFVGPCPAGMEVCHFPDRNPANNNLNNLRWDTKKANYADSVIHGTNYFGPNGRYKRHA